MVVDFNGFYEYNEVRNKVWVVFNVIVVVEMLVVLGVNCSGC